MCGITGVFAFNEVGRINQMYLVSATDAIESRGPDFKDYYQDYFVGLGHRRLSIIDTSAKGNQPMSDSSGRYTIVFNGEIYNYKELKRELEQKGHSFKSDADTEVLLSLYIKEKENCLAKLNGFFAFAIYDKQEETMFLTRDRIGIKPLLYTIDDDRFIFGSEMKSLLAYGIKKDLDQTSLFTYLQLNYTPHPRSIIKDIKKCPPGHYIQVKRNEFNIIPYYDIPYRSGEVGSRLSYEEAKKSLVDKLDKSVQRRLVADVPIGAFLSGGIDSSCITALASRHVDQLNTFSIGFKDEPFFDETKYANEVAKHLGTQHEVFSLGNDDLLNHLDQIINYIDEPFADSSAIPVYILSRETRKTATVALSGDGADEIFSGYNKHYALSKSNSKSLQNTLITLLHPLWKMAPKSRAGKIGNLFRQLDRFARGSKLSSQDRYWLWASFNSELEASKYLASGMTDSLRGEFQELKTLFTGAIPKEPTLTDYLAADTRLVLPNDMLTKVDMMSMANGLEVRVPFLDHELVEFAFSLPDEYKMQRKLRKRILRDAFQDMLPASIYGRGKHGFEVPLLKWFRKELKSELDKSLFNQELIIDQGIFNWKQIKKLRNQLHSFNPADAHAKTWGLFVFQKWYSHYMD
ncbi:MAG: asparagine synthase (glutamine-hydrolyzing) [Bacteroidetes bacterium]|nr:asparagine synthase (glutamine-hydrolyzing) [Bacteroidota bacterium]MDA1122503.1 asparagine synthase (glutamine-hydrolyzing) [Bacteroidota bacterium]